MLVRLHSQATTTPKIRAAIKASADPAWMVGERYGISEQTVLKWRHRDSVEDRSHTPHRLQTTLRNCRLGFSPRANSTVSTLPTVPAQTVSSLCRYHALQAD